MCIGGLIGQRIDITLSHKTTLRIFETQKRSNKRADQKVLLVEQLKQREGRRLECLVSNTSDF